MRLTLPSRPQEGTRCNCSLQAQAQVEVEVEVRRFDDADTWTFLDGGGRTMLNLQRVLAWRLASVYPFHVQKAEKKGRAQAEVDRVIGWLTGYTQAWLEMQLKQGVDFKTCFAQVPALNPNAALVRGIVCGERVEEVPYPHDSAEGGRRHAGIRGVGRRLGRAGRRAVPLTVWRPGFTQYLPQRLEVGDTVVERDGQLNGVEVSPAGESCALRLTAQAAGFGTS